ncbi:MULTISPECIES: hypothetical protein [unclassified Streptococcus]|uniref:hypothetical protein n=1 Tax=unclassified Streptococcus TaxID=2608887 RepID=UPI00069FC028|nr:MULTISPECIES: hypothetical protein [unclassified Streptococcus]
MFGQIEDIGSEYLVYKIDTEAGQSGSPVLNSQNQIVGTHILGDTDQNYARRVKDDTFRLPQVVQGAQLETPEVTSYMEEKSGRTFRLYHTGIKRHLYTQNLDEARTLQQNGWNYEGEKIITAASGTPVYRLYFPVTREHLYTTSSYECDILASRGWQAEGVAWYSSGQRPIYRLYHTGLKVHLYTADENEKNVLVERGWNYENVAFYVQ